MSARAIYLIGLPACGKTTLGRALPAAARRLGVEGLRFEDLDEAVEAAEGRSIAEIFRSEGEEAFRRAESALLRGISEAPDSGGILVLACGGGTPCSGDNLEYMLSRGLVVELRATREATLRRLLEAPPEQRPLVGKVHGDPGALSDEVEALAARRRLWYSRAHASFDSTLLETEEQVRETSEAFVRQFILN